MSPGWEQFGFAPGLTMAGMVYVPHANAIVVQAYDAARNHSLYWRPANETQYRVLVPSNPDVEFSHVTADPLRPAVYFLKKVRRMPGREYLWWDGLYRAELAGPTRAVILQQDMSSKDDFISDMLDTDRESGTLFVTVGRIGSTGYGIERFFPDEGRFARICALPGVFC